MFSDLRLALRSLAKSPSFVAIAVGTLALGIGVNTTMFSIVNAVILRGLPFPESNRLVHVENSNLSEGIDSMGVSWLDFADYRASQRSFVELSAYQSRTMNISGPGGEPERVTGTAITGIGMDMLGVPTVLGRWFRPEEDKPGAPATVVIGHSLWQNRFKSDPGIVGRQIKVNGEWATVVGVGPVNFRFEDESDAWMPLRFAKEEKRDNRYFEIFGRLKEGVTLKAARTEMEAIAARLARDHADTNGKVGVIVKPLRDEFVGDGTRRMLTIMLTAVTGVLLIACANVANLLLSRAAARQKDVAVRTALGASRGRIVRMLLTETLLLTVAGAALGLALAYGLMEVFDRHIQANDPTPYWMVFNIDHTGVLYVGALAVVTCVVAGVWPAWFTSRTDLTTTLKDASRGSTGASLSRFTRAMVVFEIILSCVLLVLSGLTIRSVIKIQSADLGFDTAGIFTNRLGLPEAEYPDLAKQKEFYRQLLERLSAQPEVQAASLSSIQPTWNNNRGMVAEGAPTGPGAPRNSTSRAAVSPDYFDALGIKLLQGRLLDARDTAGAPKTAVINPLFAAKHWPGQDPLGRRFRYGSAQEPARDEDWVTVVGVVSTTLQGEFEGHEPGVSGSQSYVSYLQDTESRFRTLYVKARNGHADSLAPLIRRVVREQNQDLPVYWPMSLQAMVEKAKFSNKLFAWIFGVFGCVALLLAGGGLYGVMSYSVSRRTQEIGVRMALGATARDVLRLVLRQGGGQLGLGLLLGLGLAFFGAKAMGTFLYEVNPGDPLTFAGTFLALGLSGLLACVLPALRAIRVNPVEALRNE